MLAGTYNLHTNAGTSVVTFLVGGALEMDEILSPHEVDNFVHDSDEGVITEQLEEIKLKEATNSSTNNKVLSKPNEVPFSSGKPRDKFKVSIKLEKSF